MIRAFLGCGLVWWLGLAGIVHAAEAPSPAGEAAPPALRPAEPPLQVSGVFPHLTVSVPEVPGSETGIGALMPWADRLWMVTYVAHISGEGTGLFEITPDFRITKRPESVVGTYANRMIHPQSKQCIIGPHFIDTDRRVRTCDAIKGHRLTATMTHLEEPKHKVYFLTMEGLLFEVDVNSLEARQVANVKKDLGIAGRAHFKGGYTGAGRVVVANNSYDEQDVLGKRHDGRLAEWDGKTWTILERTAFCEVMGTRGAIFATGWDPASAILKVFSRGHWSTYRLPKASHCFDHAWFTEWPRIREVETERFLMHAHGLFYELSSLTYEGWPWGLKPVASHLRMIPDFCSWRGLTVLAGDEATACGGNLFAGQPQSNLVFLKTDDLWRFGKPKGFGGVWREEEVKADDPSDPFLMTGFDKKCLHLAHNAERAVEFTVEVDFIGNGTWKTYETITVPPKGYVHHAFPAGFGAHWVRVTADAACTATAWLTYD
jgi:hypothetical protein